MYIILEEKDRKFPRLYNIVGTFENDNVTFIKWKWTTTRDIKNDLKESVNHITSFMNK